ncbi:MAG: hypothetical protein Q4G42_03535 [Neisseria sp.]|nr:hypothetical protein [Neisseria sp.]
MNKITTITKEEALNIWENYTPYGSFLFCVDGIFIAIDNTTGQAWTEEFNTRAQAINWLTNTHLSPEEAKND